MAALLAPRASAAELRSVQATPGPAVPAESDAVDTAATVGPLAIGATIHDEAGALVGRVTLLTTDADGAAVAKVRNDEEVYRIPLADLVVRRGQVVSRIPLARLKRDAS